MGIFRKRNVFLSKRKRFFRKRKERSVYRRDLVKRRRYFCKQYFCNNQECESRQLIRMDTTKLPRKYQTGLYSIKEYGTIIYVGKSQGYLRKRLQAHLGGYDGQRIGNYLKRKKNKDNISFSYVLTWRPDKKEHNAIECIGLLQGERPKFNMKRGDTR